MSIGKPKNSPFYHYDFRFRGHRFRGSTGETTERKARDFLRAEKERRRAEIKAGIVQANNPTISGVFVRYWDTEGHKKRWSYGIEKHMQGMLAHFGKDKLFGDIGNADVATMLEAYEATTERNNRGGKTTRPGKPTPSTANRRLAVLRRIYNKARIEWELQVKTINWKAHTREEPNERVRHITVEQAKTLLENLPNHIMIMVAWSLATGCRLNETETLTWARVNYETRQAEVITKGRGEKVTTRFVTLGPDAFAVLALCDRNRGKVFDCTNRRKHWEAAVKAAGLEDFRWHDLRHSFAVWVGNAGADIAVVQQLLGHSKIETTLRYRKVITGERVKAVQNLPTLIEGEVVPMKKKE